MRVQSVAVSKRGMRLDRKRHARGITRGDVRVQTGGVRARVRSDASSASVVERHEEICPAKEVVCGLVDEDDPDERTRCCPAKMRRHALATHRENMCDYVTASECSDCLKPVARRSATRHKQLCPMAQRKCVCGVMIAASKLQEHIDSQCPKQDVLCDFHEVGCVVRCPRSMMERHYAEASGRASQTFVEGVLGGARGERDHGERRGKNRAR